MNRRRLVQGGLGLAAMLWARPSGAWDPWVAPDIPPEPGFLPLNGAILRLVREYDFGAANPYRWAPGMHVDGTTRDLSYGGVPLARASADGAIHCSGITFEVWLRALLRAGVPTDLSADALLQLKEHWYVRGGDERGLARGLLDLRLGLSQHTLDAMRPGDLIQFWRNSGKGHSAVVIEHRLNRAGGVRGLAVWSAQGISEGIGIRYVSVGPGEHQIAAGRWYGVRPVVPLV